MITPTIPKLAYAPDMDPMQTEVHARTSDAIRIVPLEDIDHTNMQKQQDELDVPMSNIDCNSAVIVIPLQEHITLPVVNGIDQQYHGVPSSASNNNNG